MSNDRHSKSCLCSRVSPWAVIFLVTFFARDAAADQDLWAALEDGGKVILMRHAPVEAEAGAGDPLVRDPSCRRERNLSIHGRRQARELGSRFSERRISVSEVLHSPFCRTSETAKLAFGSASPADYLSLLEILEGEEAERQTLELSRVIGSYTGTGNLILVTHEPNISAVSFELVKHLDMVILDPKGGADFEELGVIRFLE
jgi:phosphohistidine phosphatase SixA